MSADGNNQTIPNVLPSPEEATTIDLDHCFEIIQALKGDFFEIQIFSNVTPKEFEVIAYECEDHIYPKLLYNPQLLRLVAMTPLPTHERAIEYFTDCAKALIAPYQHPHLSVLARHNSMIHGRQEGDSGVIPDLHLDIEITYPEYKLPSPFWVMECGFSQGAAEMKRKLEMAVKNAPGIDAAFMISIDDKIHNLPRKDLNHPLFHEPLLSQKDFTSTLSHGKSIPTLQPIIVKGVTWVDIQSVTISVFLRREDGTFNFDTDDPFTACGSLHPQMSVQRITTLLDQAARRLLQHLANKLEEHNLNDNDHATIHHLRNGAESTTFPIDWTLFLDAIRYSLYETAFSRYTSSVHGLNIPHPPELAQAEAATGPSEEHPAPDSESLGLDNAASCKNTHE